jgi:ribonucleotide reductase class II
MNPSNKLLSDLIAFRTYAKYIPHLQRRETFEETVNRCMIMHLEKFPNLSRDITKAFTSVHDLKVMPSMRSMQFAGPAIVKNNLRQYNCSFVHISHPRVFAEILFLLLSGTGVGFSVQKRHINQLPKVGAPREEGIFFIQDSILGWAQAIHALTDAYFYNAIRPLFNYSNIRAKGSLLVTTGAKAPGPDALRHALEEVEKRLKAAQGRHLKSIEVHDIVCIISDCVLSGGIRRSSLISLFDRNDQEMLKCKSGAWYNEHPYRARANNSALLPRQEVSKEEFLHIFNICKESNAGEPGFAWSNNLEMGGNPCFSGETLIKTADGLKPINSLVNQNIELYNIKGDLVQGKVWSNGTKETIKVKFSNGNTIVCTPDHRFMLNDGTECLAKDLMMKRLMPFVSLNNVNTNFTRLGFIQGDGSLTRLNSKDHKGLEIHIGYNDKDVATLFNVDFNPDLKSYYINGYNDILRDLGFDAKVLPERELPSTFNHWNDKQKLSFLRGLYSANGSVIKGHRIAFKGTCHKLIDGIKAALESFGIRSYITTNKSKAVMFENGEYICKESYDLNISSFTDTKKFAELIGFIHTYKQKDLLDLIKLKSPTITSIKEEELQEVFDFTLYDDTHWGVVGGHEIIAHNCFEVSLYSNQLCNLTTVNQTNIKDKRDYLNRVYNAALIGTLQAAYTDFPYVSQDWQTVTEREALLGVSFTGIADSGAQVTNEWLEDGARLVLEVNEKYAKKLGINLAARATVNKPEGTASCLLASSSGIHDRHSQWYLRRFQISKDDTLYLYLKNVIPELVEDYKMAPNTAVITIPQESPPGALLRDDTTALQLFNRAMRYNKHWIAPGHRTGDNKNNVSCTISVKDNEWDDLADSMWDNRKLYSGISLIPFDLGVYEQTPFESCTKERFDEFSKYVKNINFKDVKEIENNTSMMESSACAGGACEITYLK